MKKIIGFIGIFIFVIIISGCGKKTNKLVGTWNGTTTDGLKTTFIFTKDKKVEYSNEYDISSKGTYEIKGDEVIIKLEFWEKEKVYKYEIKDSKLDLRATDKLSPSYSGMEKSK